VSGLFSPVSGALVRLRSRVRGMATPSADRACGWLPPVVLNAWVQCNDESAMPEAAPGRTWNSGRCPPSSASTADWIACGIC